MLGAELTPGSTIMVDRKGEEEVDITVIPGEPREPEKVTVPAGADEPEGSADEPDEPAADYRSSGRGYPQPVATASASQTSRIFAGDRRQIRSRKNAFGISVRLSRLRAQARGIPSSGLNRTSVGMRRTVVVAGTANTECRTGIAGARVRMRCGRRPASGSSTHQISPRLTTAHP